MRELRFFIAFALMLILAGLVAAPRGAAQTGATPTPGPGGIRILTSGEPGGVPLSAARLPGDRDAKPGYRVLQVVPAPSDGATAPGPTRTVQPAGDGRALDLVPDWEGFYFKKYKDRSRDCAWYRNTANGQTPTVTRFDNAIDFYWTGEPASDVGGSDYLVCWDVNQSLTPGVYRLHIVADDGMRVFVNNQKMPRLDQWRDQQATWYWEDIAVPGDSQDYLLRVDYYNRVGDGIARFWWESLDSYANWKGEYFRNENLSGGPVLTRSDPAVDFSWGYGSPAIGLSYDHFSARWSRDVELAGGFYRFYVQSDDGVRLYIDPARELSREISPGQRVDAGRYLNPILDRWGVRSLPSSPDRVDVYLSPGTHKIVLEYMESVGLAQVKMWWERW